MDQRQRHQDAHGSDALERVLKFELQEHRRGEFIAPQDDGGLIIQVRRGRVLASVLHGSGVEVLSVVRGAGAVLGPEALGGLVLAYQLWTLEDTELAIAPAARARRWMTGDKAARTLLRATVQALRGSLSERVAMHGSAAERLARLLVAAADDPDPESPERVMLRLPKHVLARLLLMRPETLSRVLHRLEKAGAIRFEPELAAADRAWLARLLTKEE